MYQSMLICLIFDKRSSWRGFGSIRVDATVHGCLYGYYTVIKCWHIHVQMCTWTPGLHLPIQWTYSSQILLNLRDDVYKIFVPWKVMQEVLPRSVSYENSRGHAKKHVSAGLVLQCTGKGRVPVRVYLIQG